MKRILKPFERVFVIHGLPDYRDCTFCVGRAYNDDDEAPLGYVTGRDKRRANCPKCHGAKQEDHGVHFAARDATIVESRVITKAKGTRTVREVVYTVRLVHPSSQAFYVNEAGVFKTLPSVRWRIRKLDKTQKRYGGIKLLGIWEEE